MKNKINRRVSALAGTLTFCALCAAKLQAESPSPMAGHHQHGTAKVETDSEFGRKMMDGMAAMDKAMMAVPMTGDPDRDFAGMMIPHHQGALEMARQYLQVGKDPALRRLAEGMVVAQDDEIKIMQRRLSLLPKATNELTAEAKEEFAKAMMESMAKMDKEMAAAPMTGDPDQDFAAMMMPHHQGASDMAKPMLLHGKDPLLKRLAQEIIVTQGQEIDVMRQRLTALQSEAPTSGSSASNRDRVYTGDQTSNTVSVIDPSANKLLGIIRLGEPVPGSLSPLYRGQLLVHGLGFSPDHRTLAAISVGSNSVTFIDTATNSTKGVTYIGRSPHEGFFTPDGKELWVTVRGEDYLSIIDAVTMKETRRIQTANGPGMVLFSPDGKYAFVPSSFTPELAVVDTKSYTIVARVPQASPFSPNLAVSQDGEEVWFTLKDSGKTQVMSARPPFRILTTLATGPITNHVALIDNAKRKIRLCDGRRGE